MDGNQMLQLLAQAKSTQDVELMLQAMGQKPSTSKAAPAGITDPLMRAGGLMYQEGLPGASSVAAVQRLLGSMGQTGTMQTPSAQKAPAQGAQVSSNAAPLTPEERIAVDTAYAFGEEQLRAALQQQSQAQVNSMWDSKDNPALTLPRTGKADTRGGAIRVNENTAQHGVTATVDSQGRTTLTNIDPTTGRPTKQSQPASAQLFNPLDRTTSSSVTALVDSIRNAKNADEARGIAATLSSSIAAEKANLLQASLQQAEAELNVPQLKATLVQAELLDKKQPGWTPGMGDSQNTARLRQTLYAAQDQARQRADDNLKRNLSYNQLSAAASNAEMILSAKAKEFDAAAAREGRKEAWIEQKQWQAEAQAMELYASLSETQRTTVAKLLPPEIAADKDPAAIARYFDRQFKTDPKFRELVSADPYDVPGMAIAGNPLARSVITAEESKATGQDSALIDMRIRDAQQKASSKEAVAAWARAKTAGMPDALNESKKLVAQYNAMQLSSDKEEKALARRMQAEIATNVFKQQRQAEFVNNLGAWKVADSEFQQAVQNAAKVTGKTDMEAVLASYVGEKKGPEYLAAHSRFKELAKQAASAYSNSPFGPVAIDQLYAAIDDKVVAQGVLARWFEERWGMPANAAEWSLHNMANILTPDLR